MTDGYITVLSEFAIVNLTMTYLYLADWVYYHISNAMQYQNTALDTTALVMHDSNHFSYVFLYGDTFSYGSANFINIHNIS